MGVFGPWALRAEGFVCFFIVLVEGVSLGIYEADGIFELWGGRGLLLVMDVVFDNIGVMLSTNPKTAVQPSA